ncbi:4-oxalocrotonate tautomerase [Clostridiales bacterium PH28_bin88]|nr:4-oxalocrotonate tautomerase [Clostridiales bacterium PH28_bin88]
MPFIQIKMAKGRSTAQKQEFVEAITREAVRILQVKPEWVTVVFDEYSRDNWATGGELHSIKFGAGFGKQGTDN